MMILGIDTSCDDTSVAILRDRQILANCISSQNDIHQEFGGVVPILAKRAHAENFDVVLQQALSLAKVSLQDIENIAVTIGPGLAPALEIGVEKSQELSTQLNVPVEPIHHMEGHLLAALATDADHPNTLDPQDVEFPALGILASGNHTEIVLIHAWGKYEILGETVDDALGEAYDKVGRMLGLEFPGGPKVAQLAELGDPHKYDLPIAMRQSGDYNVSYSGIKTATLRLIRELTDNESRALNTSEIQDIAASFQRVALQTFLGKVAKVLEKYPVKNILLGGGVAANTDLRQQLATLSEPYQATVSWPYTLQLCRDNGAMIALAAFMHQKYNYHLSLEKLDRRPQWRLDDFSQKL